MEDVIRKYLCNSCLGKKEECMKYKEEQKNGIIQYKCEGERNKRPKGRK